MMTQSGKSMNIEKYIIIIFASILLVLFFMGIILRGIEKSKERVKQFDDKYKPVCDSLGGIYPQERNYRNNWCYLNQSGILRKGCMIQINKQWELVEC